MGATKCVKFQRPRFTGLKVRVFQTRPIVTYQHEHVWGLPHHLSHLHTSEWYTLDSSMSWLSPPVVKKKQTRHRYITLSCNLLENLLNNIGLRQCYQSMHSQAMSPFDWLHSDLLCAINVPLAKWCHCSVQTSMTRLQKVQTKQCFIQCF